MILSEILVIPYWRVNRYMRLYFHSKKICAYTRDAPNNKHFVSVKALAGRLETVAKLCPLLLIVVCDTLALGLAATAALCLIAD